MLRCKAPVRPAVAAVELAFLLTFVMVPTMFALWEVGRLIHVKQVVSHAAREGARLAAQGNTINASGEPTKIYAAPGAGHTINVRDHVYQFLVGAGFKQLTPDDVVVSFAFTAPKATKPGVGTYPTDPCDGEKNQAFAVTVTVPWEKVRWVNAGIIRPTHVTFTVNWLMLIDDPFTVETAIPTW